MTYSDKSPWQYMHREPTDELPRPLGSLASFVPLFDNLCRRKIPFGHPSWRKSMVGDRNLVGVSA